MFATNWLLTLFTRVVEFSLVYELWEIFLFERDKYMIFFFAIALLTTNRSYILNLKSFDKILQFLTCLRISDFETLSLIYAESVRIRSLTPLSYPILVNKLGLFESNTIISNEEVELIEGFKFYQ